MSSHLSKKSRVLRGPSEHGRNVSRNVVSSPWKTDFYNNRRDGFQLTETEGHPFKHRFTMYEGDVGGPFRSQKNVTLIPGLTSVHRQELVHPKGSEQFIGNQFDGTVVPPFPEAGQPGKALYPIGISKSIEPSSDLDSLGATAVNAANPLNPLNDAATFLAESFREGLPSVPGLSLWQERTRAVLGVAKEFLNAEFAFLPVVREMKDFASSVSKMGDVLAQYERDAGKLVRRSWYFPIEHTESISLSVVKQKTPIFGGSHTFANTPTFNPPLGDVDLIKRRDRKLWFSGAFTYAIPDGFFSGLYDGASEANKLLGSTFTPETIWELTPWSWAVDWFSNAQEVITNLQALKIEGLVMPYGYMMSEKTSSDVYSFRQTGWSNEENKNLASPLVVPDVQFVSTKKEREQANPFGFGLEFSDLSPIQLAILAALGITFAL